MIVLCHPVIAVALLRAADCVHGNCRPRSRAARALTAAILEALGRTRVRSVAALDGAGVGGELCA
jgi:hypothetical protein